ncbi:MAG: hypothetical protein M3176_14045 [Chloroflexota bacterium]|nr:hypothetical protein [Chloroflexota bacterium]
MNRRPWRPWGAPDPEPARRGGEEADDRAPGVIETIQSGYDLLNARPYLIAMPLALDLALWLGPRLTSPALFTWLARWPGRTADGADLAQALRERGASAEVTTGIAQLWNGYGVSSLVGTLGRGHVASVVERPTAAIGPWYVAVLVLLALLVIGLWLKSLFVAPIAQMVRHEPFDLGTMLRMSWEAAARAALLFLTAFGMLALTLVPVAIVAATFVLAGISGFSLIVLATLIPTVGALFYGAFAMDAIFLERVGPMRAIYLSYRVVRRNVWPTAGFVAMTILISRGVPLALTRVVQQPVGVVLAMIAHAYVAAGLATGSLLFYRERRARVVDVRPEQTGEIETEEAAMGRQAS